MKGRKLPVSYSCEPPAAMEGLQPTWLEKEVTLRSMTPHMRVKRPSWMLQLTLLDFLVIHCLCPNPETSFPRATIWGSGFGLMEGRSMSLQKIGTIAQTPQRKAVDWLDSDGWTEGFRAPYAQQSPLLYVVHLHTGPRPAGE